ncbi:hypothetical protein GCM10027074_70040 [Streptomyces deserti]
MAVVPDAATRAPVVMDVESTSGPKSSGEPNWPPNRAVAYNEVAVPRCSGGAA